MIKGVNKRIVEITSTQNDYFEKAVLYIKADKNAIADSRIELEARAYLSSLVPISKSQKELDYSKEKIPFAVKLICAAAVILALTMIICLVSVIC